MLVVEDNAHIVEMYEYALGRVRASEEAPDVEVEYASNGHEALARLQSRPKIDLVMADLFMPLLDGFGLVERMRADPQLARIPILVISAGGPDARDRALDRRVVCPSPSRFQHRRTACNLGVANSRPIRVRAKT